MKNHVRDEVAIKPNLPPTRTAPQHSTSLTTDHRPPSTALAATSQPNIPLTDVFHPVLYFAQMTNPTFPANEIPFSAIVASEAISLAMLNAVAQQQSGAVAAQAVTIMGVTTLYSINTAETGAEWKKSLDAAIPAAPAAHKIPSIAETALATVDKIASSEANHDTLESAAQLIAVATALSVVDAANYLRNVQTLSTAAMASSLLIQPNATRPGSIDNPALAAVVSVLDHSAAQFEKLCHRATDVLAQLRPLPSAGGAGEAPGNTVPDADLLKATAQALSLAVHNAVTNQQQMNITAQSATVMGVATLYAMDTATTGAATSEILDAGTPSAPKREIPTPVA